MDPNIWGPTAWLFLHTITFNYPNNPTNNDKLNYKNFFYLLSDIIPCNYCKHNFKIHMKKLPIEDALNNKNSLVKWLFNIHNLTNKHLNKNIFTYKQFISKYKTIFQKKNKCIYNNYYIYIFIIFIIIAIIFIIIYYYYCKPNICINYP